MPLSKKKSQNVSDNEDETSTSLRKSTRATRSKSVSNDNKTSPVPEESSGWKRRLRRTKSSNDNLSSNSSTTPSKKSKKLSNKDKNDNEDVDDLNFYLSPLKEELDQIEEDTQKASELFLDEEDVSGNKIYGFQTPSKKNSMIQKALSSRTPTTIKKNETKLLKIPFVLTEKLNIPTTPKSSKKKLTKIIDNVSKTPTRSTRSHPQVHFDSDSDESISEDSEFVPTDEDDDDDDDDVEDADDDIKKDEDKDEDYSNDKNQSPKRKILKNNLVPITPCRRGRSRNKIVYNEYHIKTDDYFTTQSEKSITSDNTLKRLKNPRLNEEKLKELLINKNHISNNHKNGIYELSENYKSQFQMWHFIMEEGYSLLLHGLGSKRNIIHEFHDSMISDHPSIVINGFFPNLTIKEILERIIIDVLDMTCPTNQNDCINLIEKIFSENPYDKLYLLIHNIDGVMLRSNKSQDILSRLASIKNMKLLASVDHINAPLLWDNVKKSRYNFYWWDATTFLPYEAETMYENSLLVQQNSTLLLSSLQSVFASLPNNSKSIYILLAKYQINNGKDKHYPGMSFKLLYRSARENFYVNSDLALRAQLTEFIDHKLVKNKRSVDGVDYLIIPIDNTLLAKFLEDQETN